jgi:uncharacterized membrane protein YfcA
MPVAPFLSDPITVLVLACAAFAAGVLNAIAGGGSFLTFPALVWAGVDPVSANATSAVAVSPGYLGSTLGFRRELRHLPSQRLAEDSLICASGGLLGAALLLLTPARVFSTVVPWLLLFATALFALSPWLLTRREQPLGPTFRRVGLIAVAIYGGYFNGGLGILLMALLSLTGERDLHTANALKNLGSLVLSLLSVAAFAWAGAIRWPAALLMMLAATLGGFAGARLARRLPVRAVRAVVIVTGLVMTTLFLAQNAGPGTR